MNVWALDDDFNSEKKGKQSDSASSGDSDIKVEIRTASSLSNNEQDRNWEDNSESARTHEAQDIYKYANNTGDYTDTAFPPKAVSRNCFSVLLVCCFGQLAHSVGYGQSSFRMASFVSRLSTTIFQNHTYNGIGQSILRK